MCSYCQQFPLKGPGQQCVSLSLSRALQSLALVFTWKIKYLSTFENPKGCWKKLIFFLKVFPGYGYKNIHPAAQWQIFCNPLTKLRLLLPKKETTMLATSNKWKMSLLNLNMKQNENSYYIFKQNSFTFSLSHQKTNEEIWHFWL